MRGLGIRLIVLALCLLAACGGTRHDPTTVEQAPARDEEEHEVVEEDAELSEPTQCELIEEDAAHVLRPLDSMLAGWSGPHADEVRRAWAELTSSMRRCIDAGRGAWMFVPRGARISDPAGRPLGVSQQVDFPLVGVEYEIVYVPPDRPPVLDPPEAARVVDLSIDTNPDNLSGAALRILGVRDLDGDGVAELALEEAVYQADEGDATYAYLTVGADGRATPYAPAAAIPVVSLVDHDRDGRVDIVNHTRFWTCRFYNDSDGTSGDGGCPPVLFHATEDGSFSASDSVAAGFLRERCPAPPAELIEREPYECRFETTLHSIACARLRGRTAADVEATIRAQLRNIPRECRSPALIESFVAQARIDPPLVLTRADAARPEPAPAVQSPPAQAPPATPQPAPRTPAPIVRLRIPDLTSEGMSEAVTRRIVQRHQNEVRHCYELALQRDPSLIGGTTSFAIELEADAEGAVRSVRVTESMREPDLDTCMLDSHRRWTFPPGAAIRVGIRYELRTE